MKNENTLLDLVSVKLGAKNDAALARALSTLPPNLSKIRHGSLPVSATLVIKIHELTSLAVDEIKEFITRGPQVAK